MHIAHILFGAPEATAPKSRLIYFQDAQEEDLKNYPPRRPPGGRAEEERAILVGLTGRSRTLNIAVCAN